jgi:hypothetical protein
MKAPSPPYRPAHSMARRPDHPLAGRTAWATSYKPKHAASKRSSLGVLQRPALAIAIAAATVTGMVATPAVTGIAAAATPQTLDLRVLVIGGGSTDPTTAAWESALTNEGVAYTEVDVSGTTVTLPTLSSGSTGYFNGVVIADSPTNFAAGQLSSLYSYESTFRVNQVDGYMFPNPQLGATDVTSGALDGTTGELNNPNGLSTFPELAGPIPFSTGTFGYGATITAGAPYTTLITDAAGGVLAGIYQHGNTLLGSTTTPDPQAGVSELSLYFNYNPAQLQWLLLAPGLINWVTQGTHLGEYRNYLEMDIDDTFTPDDAWDATTHEIDYNDADSLRMTPQDVTTSAEWSKANNFRLDQLFNFGSTVSYGNGTLDFSGAQNGNCTAAAPCPDPLLAQFQASDPSNSNKPYSDDFGWISHTYDTPYLDVGCATTDYIEAELNENTSSIEAPAGTTPGTGGLGLATSNDDTLSTGYQDPQIFVPGNHSGFANLVPGNPATVDEPALDVTQGETSTAGTLAPGTYDYAVTDQFTATPVPVPAALGLDGESAADLTGPITVSSPDDAVSLQWQAICHAANYNVYRATCSTSTCTPLPTSWTLIGNYTTPFSSTLPNNSSGDANPLSTTSVTGAGEAELTFTDNGGTTSQCEDGSNTPAGYCAAYGPPPWSTPPVTEYAEESPWEQNPYFIPALQGAGITAVGADASKPYPANPTSQFFPDPSTTDPGNTDYVGPEYAAGQTFLEGTSSTTWPGAQVVPRHPINIYYNASTDAEELDEYNTLFTPQSAGGQCVQSSTTTCNGPGFTYPDITNSIVGQMFQFVLQNNPEPSYVHQTNTIGILPGCTTATWAANPDTCEIPPDPTCALATCMPTTAPATGDGTLYSVLNPLLGEYNSYFSSQTPYVQLTEGQIATVLANQSAWSNTETTLTSTATPLNASETNGVVTIANNTSGALEVPVTVPSGTVNGTVLQGPGGTSYNGLTTYGTSYGGDLSGWLSLGGGATQLLNLPATAPAITSAATATSTVGTPFSFTVNASGSPAPTLTETGALPANMTFTDNGNGTATIAGTSLPTTGGSYPITITATNASGTATQAFSLTNVEGPVSITSSATATFTTGVTSTFNILTTGYPITLSETGTMPSGLTLATNSNGLGGTISGTPAATSAGTYQITVTATNSLLIESVPLAMTIIVNTAATPVITSAAGADFYQNQANQSFTVTTTGAPTPAISETGTMPAGLALVNNGDGTATIAGTPTATGTYPITITASNGIGTAPTQSFTITVGAPAAFTSADTASGAVGSPFTFTVTTSGYPAPSFGWGTLPPNVGFTPNTDGTATLSGTPTTPGVYAVALSAGNLFNSTDATQTLTVTIGEAPAITSATNTTFTTGTTGTFTVTSTGSPNAAISETGALPSGVTLVSNGDGTATLSGAPAAGTGGSYPITITANNGVSPNATQSFTLTVDQAPAITSVNTTTFSVGTAGTFTVTSTGYPSPAVTESGMLPSGVTLNSNGDGTATLMGTPSAGTAGNYPFTITASNGIGTNATQSFTLVVNQAPAITTGSTTTFTVGTAGSFPVTATGSPTLALSESGALPSGVNFVDNGSGNGLLSGTPGAGTGGTYTFTITASNGVLPNATQSFTLTVDQAPGVTTSGSTTFTVGTAGTINVGTTGYPTVGVGGISLSTGSLPAGLTLTPGPAGSGTATITGTPNANTAGSYPITLDATNGVSPDGTDSLTLTVNPATTAPAITTGSSATFTVGTAGSFPVTATGSPTLALSESGALPSGVTFVDSGSGNGLLSGTPAAGTGGPYTFTITASNGVLPNATQSFTLTVNQAPAFMPSNLFQTTTVGTSFSTTIGTTGSPAPTITESGALPSGLGFSDPAGGTATISGTPTGTGGMFTLQLTASNGIGTSATEVLIITVDASPLFTSGNAATFAASSAGSFQVVTTGYPTPTLALATGTLPSGVTFTPGSNGTAALSGTPAAGTQGTYALTITAGNSVSPGATQSLTLTVNSGLAITSGSSDTITAGKAMTAFTVTTTGSPTPTLGRTGTLPSGVTFTANTNGTATLSGTPAATANGIYLLTFTARNSTGTVSQSFTLTVDQTPAFSSAATATETAGVAFSFEVSATGYPTPMLALSAGTLPSGVTFTPSSNGTGTLAGTAASASTSTLTFSASNPASVSQTFTLTIKAAGTGVPVPTFTSQALDTVTSGVAFSFVVTTTGYPTTTYTTSVTHSGTLPGGVGFNNMGNGSAIISGTPTAASAGTYTITLTARNSAGTVTQTFVLTVQGPPAFSSAASVTSTVGSAFSFTVKTTGSSPITITESGALPSGVTFTPNGSTATIAGTPGVNQGKVYNISFTASNSFGPTTQAFTLTVNQAPSIAGGSSVTITATHGVAITTHSFTTTGYPVPSLSRSGAVPRGMTFTNPGNGTATLSGTPTTAGTYTFTLTARNSVGAFTQTITLAVS